MIQEEIVRRERRQKLIDANTNPYPSSTKRTHTIADFQDQFDVDSTIEAALVGRIKAIRKHGGLTFVRFQDASGIFQAVLMRDDIGVDSYTFFHEIADIGDFFEFTGSSFLTKKGEKSLKVTGWGILSKSTLPLPEKWHGLTDVEKRYRHRYLDLISNEQAMHIARTRSKIVSAIRRHLEEEEFIEVETPVLQPIAGGTTAKPFMTHHETLDHNFYLRIAPELYLKRLLVGGFEKIYEYARCYRNEGISPQHNPEFTQIEAYWAYATIEDLMTHLEKMLETVAVEATGSTLVHSGEDQLSFSAPLPRKTFHEIVLTETGIDLNDFPDEESLKKIMSVQGMQVEHIIGYAELVDTLYKEKVRPNIVQPTFITDYPAAMKPLAKKRENNPNYSAGAQLVVKGVELWNAFNELNDPIEQEERFMEQEALRERGSEDAQRIDYDYLKALKHGMPPAAGYGLGIDRLVMLMTGATNIKEVILFPTLKPTDQDEGDDQKE